MAPALDHFLHIHLVRAWVDMIRVDADAEVALVHEKRPASFVGQSLVLEIRHAVCLVVACLMLELVIDREASVAGPIDITNPLPARRPLTPDVNANPDVDDRVVVQAVDEVTEAPAP